MARGRTINFSDGAKDTLNTKKLRELSISFHKCKSKEQIQKTCSQLVDVLDIKFYSFAAVFLMEEPVLYLVDEFPPSWSLRYKEQGYKNRDPLVKHCMQHTDPLLWSDIVYDKHQESQVEQQIMTEAAEYGLEYGITFPVHGPGIECSMLSLCWHDATRTVSEVLVSDLQLLAFSIHRAVKSIAQNDCVIKRLPPKLTTRERQCLVLTAHGKTAKQISQNLELSESTVTFHLKNVMEKMGATNRPHAVARAIAESRIILM